MMMMPHLGSSASPISGQPVSGSWGEGAASDPSPAQPVSGSQGREVVCLNAKLESGSRFESVTMEAAAEKGKGQKARTQDRLNCMNTTRRG